MLLTRIHVRLDFSLSLNSDVNDSVDNFVDKITLGTCVTQQREFCITNLMKTGEVL